MCFLSMPLLYHSSSFIDSVHSLDFFYFCLHGILTVLLLVARDVGYLGFGSRWSLGILFFFAHAKEEVQFLYKTYYYITFC